MVEHIKINSNDAVEINYHKTDNALIDMQSNFHKQVMQEEGYGDLPICFGKRKEGKKEREDKNVVESSGLTHKKTKISKSQLQTQKKVDKYKWGNLHPNFRNIIHLLPLPPYCKRRGNARPQEDNVYLCPYLEDTEDTALYLVRVVGVGPTTTSTSTTTIDEEY